MEQKDYINKVDAIIADSSKFVQVPVDYDNPKSYPVARGGV